eukprot:TRINITY_DN10308_c0_g1_i4.p1 TRINITY_DN10308_c0_g1~~TRINITY_DN10308_c0_g1_i4.p1  ORF type:complete len:263 (+),score=29.72 TRINITY_DN10308_c0_g1_i4:198-986(+)
MAKQESIGLARPFARVVRSVQCSGRRESLDQPVRLSRPWLQVHNGSLQLFARHENITDPNLKKMGYANFTTSFVASQRPVRYGYFEIRARVGSSKVSSSFWFYNSNTTAHHWTEIDVFEMTGEHASQQLSTQDAMHTHVFMLPKENTSFLPDLCDCSLPHETALYQLQDAPSCSQANYTHRSTPYSQDFHVFGLLWTPEKLEYTVDGLMQWSLPNACMHQPLFLTFDRETMPDWFGLPSPVNLPDQPLTVEYVRAWTQDDWS